MMPTVAAASVTRINKRIIQVPFPLLMCRLAHSEWHLDLEWGPIKGKNGPHLYAARRPWRAGFFFPLTVSDTAVD
jgi:hypothetical protein